jgi:hypothetical protein
MFFFKLDAPEEGHTRILLKHVMLDDLLLIKKLRAQGDTSVFNVMQAVTQYIPVLHSLDSFLSALCL